MDDESRTGPTAPHSLEAEREVIASVLLNEEHLDALSERVRPEDFYIERYRIIWESFGRLPWGCKAESEHWKIRKNWSDR